MLEVRCIMDKTCNSEIAFFKENTSFSPSNMLQVCYHGAVTATISSPGTTTCQLLFGYGIFVALSLQQCLCRKTQSVLPLGTPPAHASFCARRALTCTCGHRLVPAVWISPCRISGSSTWSGIQMGAAYSWRTVSFSAVLQLYLPCLRKDLINLMKVLKMMNDLFVCVASA